MTIDSTKILTEKLTLARELSILRPEVEYLRSQMASQHSLLADKSSLQRQLGTCQVELETERNSIQRLLAREDRLKTQDSLHESRLQDLQAELATEKLERQKAERQAQQESTEWENQIIILESRAKTFKNKFKATYEKLQEEQQKKFNSATSTIANANSAIAAGGGREAASKNPGKRKVASLDSDKEIGTPGVLLALKKSKRASTLPGDKSMFSITPFLNRTGSLAPASPISGRSDSGEDERSDRAVAHPDAPQYPNEGSPATEPREILPIPSTSEDARVSTTKCLGRVRPGKVGVGAVPKRKKPLNVPHLEQVPEEGNNEEGGTFNTARPKVVDDVHTGSSNSDDINLKKRKRKFLKGFPAGTIFDEDEEEVSKGGRGPLRGVRDFRALGRAKLDGARLCDRAQSSQAKEEFGAFSPLKRDRKAIWIS